MFKKIFVMKTKLTDEQIKNETIFHQDNLRKCMYKNWSTPPQYKITAVSYYLFGYNWEFIPNPFNHRECKLWKEKKEKNDELKPSYIFIPKKCFKDKKNWNSYVYKKKF